MQKERIAVLGISIGTRRVGIAILKDNELVDWRVKTFKGQWCSYKLSAIQRWFEKVAEFYSVDAIALKIPGLIESSPGLKDLIGYCRAQFNCKGINVAVFTIGDLKAQFLPQGRNNKKALLECITEKFPEVYLASRKEKSNRNPHYISMFEAIGAAHLLCQKQLEEKTNKLLKSSARKKTIVAR